MANVRIAFKIVEPNNTVPIGFTKVPLRMIFDLKLDFMHKARLVVGGLMTSTPTELTYSSVVSRDSIHICFPIATHNNLDIQMTDVGNAYLNATTKEKWYAIAGKDFGEDEGKAVLIVRALYGLKSSGAAWHAHLASSILDMGFSSSLADPDVWLRAANHMDGIL